MSSRPTFLLLVAGAAVVGISACKTVYSDTFSYRKNAFQPPVVKAPEIKLPPTVPQPLEGAQPGGALPGIPGGGPALDGGMPAIPGGAPVPGIPAVPEVPGVPGVPPAPGVPGIPPAPAPGVPAAPAIPGLN